VRSPILGAGSRVKGENIELGGADQSVVHHDQAGLKGSELTDVVSAQNNRNGLAVLGGVRTSKWRLAA
jgi:hypothetical protein